MLGLLFGPCRSMLCISLVFSWDDVWSKSPNKSYAGSIVKHSDGRQCDYCVRAKALYSTNTSFRLRTCEGHLILENDAV